MQIEILAHRLNQEGVQYKGNLWEFGRYDFVEKGMKQIQGKRVSRRAVLVAPHHFQNCIKRVGLTTTYQYRKDQEF